MGSLHHTTVGASDWRFPRGDDREGCAGDEEASISRAWRQADSATLLMDAHTGAASRTQRAQGMRQRMGGNVMLCHVVGHSEIAGATRAFQGSMAPHSRHCQPGDRFCRAALDVGPNGLPPPAAYAIMPGGRVSEWFMVPLSKSGAPE